MPFVNQVKTFLDRPRVRPILAPIVSQMARASRNGVAKISYDDDVWIHQTASGYFAYHQPYVRLDLTRLDTVAKENFFWDTGRDPATASWMSEPESARKPSPFPAPSGRGAK
jgi:hypothetical protein